MRILIIGCLIVISAHLCSQPNCEYFKYIGDSTKYLACKVSEERIHHYQFSRKYHEILDATISIDPTYDFAWLARSTSYLKSGDFITWKKLIDRAVEINPIEHLGGRAWCRYQFFRDYQGAINDIERLDELIDYDIGHSTNANYHLHVARALCYKALGDKARALDILNEILVSKDYQIGLYDYLHLGVLYAELKQYHKALDAFDKQDHIDQIAESHYYRGLIYKNLNNTSKYRASIEKAKRLYDDGLRITNPYTEYADKIYLQDIEKELEPSNK